MNINRLRIAILLFTSLILSSAGYAQNITSSGMNGTVTDSDGNPVAGANVRIVHVPTGTTKTMTSTGNGSFAVRGMRVGGPYSVTASFAGYQTSTEENIYLTVASVSNIVISMADAADITELEEFIFTEEQEGLFNRDSRSSVTRLDEARVLGVSSADRSLNELLKMNPKVSVDKDFGSFTAGGINARYNNVMVDGVRVNDPFGLNSNGQATRNGPPVSIDAIESLQIDTAPFDIRQSKFTGAAVNVVTKSGTNQFHGSAYYYWRDSDQFGENENGQAFDPVFTEKTYGFTLGGPILKNKLFFFFNYEKLERERSGTSVGLIGSGATNIFPGTQAEIDEIIDIATNVWGLSPGTPTGADILDDSVEKIMVKVDWNINDKHHLSFKYDKAEDNVVIITQRNTAAFSLSSYWYDQPSISTNYVAQLFSDWNDRFSTEIRYSFSDYDGSPVTPTNDPQVAVAVASGNNVFMGAELFRHFNFLFAETTTFTAAGTLFSGANRNHETVFGLDFSKKIIANTFLFANKGVWNFASVDDFRAGIASGLFHRFEAEGTNVTANWEEKIWSPYLQHTWRVHNNFSMTVGIRWDINDFPLKPGFNQRFQDFFGRPNDNTIDGERTFSTRFSFNWDIKGDSTVQLRGGIGKFFGKSPGVWLSNGFTNDGLTVLTASFPDGNPAFEPDSTNQPKGVPGAPSGEVDSLAAGFNSPSSWKGVLALDYKFKAPLLGDMVATIEGEWSFVEDAVVFRNLVAEPVGTGPDGRIIMSTARAGAEGFGGFGSVTELRNTSLGDSTNYTLTLTRPMREDGWFSTFAYSYGSSNEVNSGTGFIAVENFRATPIFNANTDELGTSPFEVRHNFIWAISKQIKWGGENSKWKTNISLFYQGRSGKPYSYVAKNNTNNDDCCSTNDLFYTPNGPDDPFVTWAADPSGVLTAAEAADRDAFFAFVAQHPDLEPGKRHQKNDATLPWIHQWDLKIAQDIPIATKWGKLQFTIDFLNIGNLINSSYGQIRDFPIGFGGTPSQNIASATYIEESNKYLYSFNGVGNTAIVEDRLGQSRWNILFGIKYIF